MVDPEDATRVLARSKAEGARRRRIFRRSLGILGLAVTATVMSVLGSQTAMAQDEPPRTGGAYWYGRYGCTSCHGTRGEGTLMAPPLAGTPLNEDGIALRIRTPLLLMPDYPPDVMPEEQLRAIAEYVRSFAPAP